MIKCTMDQMFWSSQNIWTYSSSKLKKFLVKLKVNKNNTSEFISPPIFVGLGSNSAWPCAANWCTNTLCYIFSLIYFENSFLANKLSSWISSYPGKKSAICSLFLFLCPSSGNVYRLLFFLFCSDKNRKLDLDFQVVCQNRQKLEMTFATKCINKPKFRKEFSAEFQYIQVKATHD